MLSPQSMSVDLFFQREDEEKQFILQQIQAAENPAKTMENYKACLAAINSREHFAALENSGFFTILRSNACEDTKEEVLHTIERHFGL